MHIIMERRKAVLTDEQMKRISELLKKGNDVVLKMVKDKITIVYQKPNILKTEQAYSREYVTVKGLQVIRKRMA